MALFLTSEKLEMTVYGYIKSVNFWKHIPEVIISIIVEFAKLHFNWKQSKYGTNAFKFNDNNPARITRMKTNRNWVFLVIDDVISLDVCRKFVWELEIIFNIDKDISFMIGFVEYPMEESIQNWYGYFGSNSRTKARQFGIFIDSFTTHFLRQGRSESKYALGVTEAKQWELGDRFKMIIDFDTREISLMYNDTDLFMMYSNIPSRLMPAICVHNSIELVCTKYQFE